MADSKNKIRLDTISNAVSALGGGDDLAQYGRPSLSLSGRLSTPEIRVLRSQNDLVQRIIEELVTDAMRPGATIRAEDTGEVLAKTDPSSAFWEDLSEAATNGRAYGTGYLLHLTDRKMDEYVEPLDPSERPIGTIPLDVDEVSARRYFGEQDFGTPDARFGRPVIWSVSPSGSGGAFIGRGGYAVHTSRLSKFPGTKLDRTTRRSRGDEHDDSVVQAVWAAVRRFVDTEQAIATIVHKFETATYKIPGLEEILVGGREDELIDRLRLAQISMSIINAIMVDSKDGGDYRRDFANVSGLDDIWDRMALSVAKAAKMPMTQLFGMAPAGLSSDDASGRALWRKQLADYQRSVLEPALLRYYRLELGREDIVIEFGEIDELTPMEKAEIDEKRAKTITSLVATAVITPAEGRAMLVESGLAPPNFEPDVVEDLARAGQSVGGGGGGDQTGLPTEVDRDDPTRKDASDTYNAPEAARNNAQKALDWKEEHGDEVKGMTQVGWTRANQLALNENLSRETVGRMAAFARHRKNADVAPEFEDEPWKDAGHVAWLGWGGTTGVDWAGDILDGEDD